MEESRRTKIGITYDIYSMPIGRYSLLDKTGDYSLISRVLLPLPNRYLIRKYTELQLEVAKLFNKNPIDKEIYKLFLFNKLVLLEAVYTALTIGRGSKEALSYFRENFGEYKKLSDLEPLKLEIEKISTKYKEAQIEVKKDETNRQFFESIISGIELILDRNLPRSLTLYEFKYQYDAALKKAESAKTKPNG